MLRSSRCHAPPDPQSLGCRCLGMDLGQAACTQQSEPGAFRASSPGFSQGQMHAGQWRPRPPPPHGPDMTWGAACELSDSGVWEDQRAEVWGGSGRSQSEFRNPPPSKKMRIPRAGIMFGFPICVGGGGDGHPLAGRHTQSHGSPLACESEALFARRNPSHPRLPRAVAKRPCFVRTNGGVPVYYVRRASRSLKTAPRMQQGAERQGTSE